MGNDTQRRPSDDEIVEVAKGLADNPDMWLDDLGDDPQSVELQRNAGRKILGLARWDYETLLRLGEPHEYDVDGNEIPVLDRPKWARLVLAAGYLGREIDLWKRLADDERAAQEARTALVESVLQQVPTIAQHMREEVRSDAATLLRASDLLEDEKNKARERERAGDGDANDMWAAAGDVDAATRILYRKADRWLEAGGLAA